MSAACPDRVACCPWALPVALGGGSARLTDDDIAVRFSPFLTLVQTFGGIEKNDGNPVGKRLDVPAGRKVLAIAQQFLRIRQHEIEKQDRGIGVCGMPG